MYSCRNSPAADVPDYGPDWTIDARVADLLAVTEGLAEGPVHLVGESYGGTVCLTAALDHPGRFASVTCTNTAHVGASVKNVSEWQAILDEGGVEGWSDYIMEARFAPDALSDAQRGWFSTQQRTHGYYAILHILRSLLEVNLLPRLASLGTPTLLMNGDQSPFVAVEVMEEMRDALPDAHLRIFPGVRHGLPFSHAIECAAELRAFLDERF
jgi:pimeloyl-ACP methyl ester carboxylesterase